MKTFDAKFWHRNIQRFTIGLASLWLCWLVVRGFRLGLPAAALAFLEVIHHIEQAFIGSWLDRILQSAIWLFSKFGITLHLADHSRYAFNLMALKLLGDAQVDYARFHNVFEERYGAEAFVWREIGYLKSSKEMHFLGFEAVLGFLIALSVAILVSQFPFGGDNMMFAVLVIGAVLVYEFIKALGHIYFDLYQKGWRSNAWRYLAQFFTLTLLTAIVALSIGGSLSKTVGRTNDALLTVFLFIVLLALQQFLSAAFTVFSNWRKGRKIPRYRTLGQVKIGERITFLLLGIFGWMLIATIFAYALSWLH